MIEEMLLKLAQALSDLSEKAKVAEAEMADDTAEPEYKVMIKTRLVRKLDDAIAKIQELKAAIG